MPNDPHVNPEMYFSSITDEVLATASRVRSLIGSAHWLSDGTYKERILRRAIIKMIGRDLTVADGFLMCPINADPRWLWPGEGTDIESAHERYYLSRQIDLLILDEGGVAPLFQDDTFVIALVQQAVAALEVKSTLSRDTLLDAYHGLTTAHALKEAHRHRMEDKELFTGMVCFRSDMEPEAVAKIMRRGYVWRVGIDHTADNLRARSGPGETRVTAAPQCLLPKGHPHVLASLEEGWVALTGWVQSQD